MKAPKIKTYVITVSRYFPQYHPRKGEETGFVGKILCAITNATVTEPEYLPWKLHTIRGNLELWQKRIAEVQAGKAVLSLRYWSGKPYNSPQVEFAQLTAADGVGVQPIYFYCGNVYEPIINNTEHRCKSISNNDGLIWSDFKSWFLKGGYDLNEPLAIIHFTPFRY